MLGFILTKDFGYREGREIEPRQKNFQTEIASSLKEVTENFVVNIDKKSRAILLHYIKYHHIVYKLSDLDYFGAMYFWA